MISSLGRVKSLGRVTKMFHGGAYKHLERVMKLSRGKQGYMHVGIGPHRKSTPTVRVHRLVAEAFIPNPEGKKTVNHINGVEDDNRVENLEWVTQSENNKRAWATGLRVKRYGSRKFTMEEILSMRDKYVSGASLNDVGVVYGISGMAAQNQLKRAFTREVGGGWEFYREYIKVHTGRFPSKAV